MASREEELIAAMKAEIASGKGAAGALGSVPEAPKVKGETDPVFGVPVNPKLHATPYKDEDWDPDSLCRIPEVRPYFFSPNLVERMQFARRMGGPIMLWGPTGTGKSSFPEQYAARMRMPFFRTQCHEGTESADLIGAQGLKGKDGVAETTWSITDVIRSYDGGMLVVDEFERTNALMAIQSLLEDPSSLVVDGKRLTPKRPWMVVLTGNTNGLGDSDGKYRAQVQDLSTLDRISHAIYVDYPEVSEELAMLTHVYGKGDDKLRTLFLKVVNLVRAAFKEGKIMQTMSIRASLNWWKYYEFTGDIQQSYRHAFFEKLGPDCQAIANNCYRQVFGKDV